MKLREGFARVLVTGCARVSILAVACVTIYMIQSGLPAMKSIGIKNFIWNLVWMPTAAKASYGIGAIILTSLVGTGLAILLGVPIGLLTSIFLAELAPGKLARILRTGVELLAGIPSVIYGLLGLMVLTPAMYRLEKLIFEGDAGHQYTGGANLLSAVLVLAMMILPTIITMSETALRAVPRQMKEASLGLGATRIQTIFWVMVPAASSGIATGLVLGVSRAIGEAMAISLVAGSSVNLPLPFASVRFLTTAIVSEMSYAEGLHRQALFSIGLILFLFIIGSNLIMNRLRKRGAHRYER